MVKSTLFWKAINQIRRRASQAERPTADHGLNPDHGRFDYQPFKKEPTFITVTIIAAHKQDPLHGITLERILTELRAQYSWEQLAEKINLRCFQDNPSIISSLKFLRRTPWARAKVERLYVKMIRLKARTAPRPRRPKKIEPNQR